MMTETKESLIERSIKDRAHDFSDLLNSISTLSDKKKQLWVEIYENAISDRKNSYDLFNDLLAIVKNATAPSTEYAVHAKALSTFVEKMSRANDQLIKLAELIAAAEQKTDEINPDDMFDIISRGGKKN